MPLGSAFGPFVGRKQVSVAEGSALLETEFSFMAQAEAQRIEVAPSEHKSDSPVSEQLSVLFGSLCHIHRRFV